MADAPCAYYELAGFHSRQCTRSGALPANRRATSNVCRHVEQQDVLHLLAEAAEVRTEEEVAINAHDAPQRTRAQEPRDPAHARVVSAVLHDGVRPPGLPGGRHHDVEHRIGVHPAQHLLQVRADGGAGRERGPAVLGARQVGVHEANQLDAARLLGSQEKVLAHPAAPGGGGPQHGRTRLDKAVGQVFQRFLPPAHRLRPGTLGMRGDHGQVGAAGQGCSGPAARPTLRNAVPVHGRA
jgi:hypothetical protein